MKIKIKDGLENHTIDNIITTFQKQSYTMLGRKGKTMHESKENSLRKYGSNVEKPSKSNFLSEHSMGVIKAKKLQSSSRFLKIKDRLSKGDESERSNLPDMEFGSKEGSIKNMESLAPKRMSSLVQNVKLKSFQTGNLDKDGDKKKSGTRKKKPFLAPNIKFKEDFDNISNGTNFAEKRK
jgi:hypothetical protein